LCFSACSTSSNWVAVPKYPIVNDGVGSSQSASYQWNRRPSGQIAPGHLIALDTPDPKVQGEYLIEFDNTLKLPYDVRIDTAGLTESQLTEKIRSAYQSYFRSPSSIKVSIAKKEYMVDVEVLVKKPGQYAVQQNGSLDEIIAKADGLSVSNNRDEVARYVTIKGTSGSGTIRLADYHSGVKTIISSWQGGETLFFQSEGGPLADAGKSAANLVHVLGQVKNPGVYAVEDKADFFTYMIKAGGPNDRADLGNITVIRFQENQTNALSFDMQDVKHIPQILSGDTIIFNADNASPFEKKSRLGANLANILATIGVIIIAIK